VRKIDSDANHAISILYLLCHDSLLLFYLFWKRSWPRFPVLHFIWNSMMMSALPEGRSRWIVISDVLSWSWEWPEQRWFPLAFLCRQWNMNGLSRAAHMNSHYLYLSLYKPKYDWMTEFMCCSSALRSHTKFVIRALPAGICTGDLWVASQACYHLTLTGILT